MDKYRSDDDSRRIAPGDYECDENGCKESEGEKPFFDVLTTKLNLITEPIIKALTITAK